MTPIKICAVLLLSGLVAACASTPPKPQATKFVPDEDMCGASQYQNYVGKPLTVLDDMQFEVPVRAIPQNAVVSMDFNLRRLNFFGDNKGVISRVYCG